MKNIYKYLSIMSLILFINGCSTYQTKIKQNTYTNKGCVLLNKKDYKNAKIELEKAVLNKECKGMYNLALIYINGHGVKQDYSQAIKYFKQSLKCGYLNSAYDIGVMHKNGEGIPKNINKAKEYYLIASKNNYALAQFELGKIYGSEKKIEKFIFWANKALKNGYKPKTKNDKQIIEYLNNNK